MFVCANAEGTHNKSAETAHAIRLDNFNPKPAYSPAKATELSAAEMAGWGVVWCYCLAMWLSSHGVTFRAESNRQRLVRMT